MQKIFYYCLKQIGSVFLLLTLILASLLWLTQSLKYLELLLNSGQSILLLLSLITYSLPTFLSLLLPLSAAAAILYTYNRLINERELIVMRSAGMSNIRLFAPIFALASFLLTFGFYNTTTLTPQAFKKLYHFKQILLAETSFSFIKAGEFNQLTKDITLYAESKPNAQTLQGIILLDRSKAGQEITLIAENALLENKRERGIPPKIDLLNGYRQIKDLKSGTIEQSFFEHYYVEYKNFQKPKKHTKFFRELKQGEFSDYLKALHIEKPYKRHVNLHIEYHKRLTSPLYIFLFCIVAGYFMLYASFKRIGQLHAIAKALTLIILFESWSIMSHTIVKNNLSFIFLLYAVPIALILTFLFLIYKNRNQIY